MMSFFTLNISEMIGTGAAVCRTLVRRPLATNLCLRFMTSANPLPRQQPERILPKLSAWSPHSYLASPPNRLILRSLSSSSPPCLPSTTTYEELCAALASEDVLVVDVRQPKELASDGAIPGAVNIPLGQVAEVFSMSPDKWESLVGRAAPQSDSPIIFSCLAGIRSHKAQVKVTELGFSNTSNFTGGWAEWGERSRS